MQLTDRDREVLLFLRSQGFASFDQLCKRFFKTKQNTSNRLVLLEKNQYLKSHNLKSYLTESNSKFFPYIQGLGINPKTKIYTLHNVFKRQFSETNRLIKKDLLLHQLLLNDIYFFISDQVLSELNPDLKSTLVLNDPEHKLLATVDITKRKEFTPDLTILSGEMCLSVELERTAKNQNRYQERFWFYEDSSFTHVIYFYVNESHLPNLLKYSGLARKFCFAHYLKPELVFSNIFGHMQLNSWINKINTVEGINKNEIKRPTKASGQLFNSSL